MNINEILAKINEGQQNVSTLNYLKTYINYLIQEEKTSDIEKYLNRAIKLAGDLQLPREEGTLLIELGVHYWNQIDYKSALNMFRLSCGIFKQSKNEYDLVVATHNVGETYTKIGDFNNAISFLKLSLDFISKIKDHDKVEVDSLCSDINNSLGTAYRKCKSYALSMSTYFKALDLQERHDLKAKICTTNLNIGKMFIDIGNYERALRYFNKALEISVVLNDISLKSQTHALIAKVYFKNAKYSQAIPFYEEALSYLDETNSKLLYHKIRTKYQMALNYSKLKKYDKVIEVCQDSLTCMQNNDYPALASKIKFLIGKTLEIQEKYDQAMPMLESALTHIASEDASNSLKFKILHTISQIYEKQENYLQAYSHLVKANEYVDLLIQEKQDKALSEIEAKYESQQKVREEIMLKKANKEVEELKEKVNNLSGLIHDYQEIEHFFGLIPKEQIMTAIKKSKDLHLQEGSDVAVVKITLTSQDEFSQDLLTQTLKDISKVVMFYTRANDEVGFWGDDSLILILSNVKSHFVDKVIEKIKLPIYNDILYKVPEARFQVDFSLMD
jgi:tetratricopeptide (TPR) repeat protein